MMCANPSQEIMIAKYLFQSFQMPSLYLQLYISSKHISSSWYLQTLFLYCERHFKNLFSPYLQLQSPREMEDYLLNIPSPVEVQTKPERYMRWVMGILEKDIIVLLLSPFIIVIYPVKWPTIRLSYFLSSKQQSKVETGKEESYYLHLRNLIEISISCFFFSSQQFSVMYFFIQESYSKQILLFIAPKIRYFLVGYILKTVNGDVDSYNLNLNILSFGTIMTPNLPTDPTNTKFQQAIRQ